MSLDEKKELRVHIRWMIRRDMTEILEVETLSFEFPWSEEDFVRCLRQRNCIGMVAEHGDRVVGFMIYELHKSRLHLLNFADNHDYRSNRIGMLMVNKLVCKLSHQRRTRILLEVRERNLAAQVFFRSLGFRAISGLRDGLEETSEDADRRELRYQPTLGEALPPINRITRLAG